MAEKVLQEREAVVRFGLGRPIWSKQFPQAETWLALWHSGRGRRFPWRALCGQICGSGEIAVTVPAVEMKAGFAFELAANPRTVQPMEVRAEAAVQPAFDVCESSGRLADNKRYWRLRLQLGIADEWRGHAFGKLALTRNRLSVNVAHDVL